MTADTPVSRSERLVQLIENAGTTSGVRLMAAMQLATYIENAWCQEQAAEGADYGIETMGLLNRLVKLVLSSKNWDVRMATAMALARSLDGIGMRRDKCMRGGEDDLEQSVKILKEFCLHSFMNQFDPLVASSGAVNSSFSIQDP